MYHCVTCAPRVDVKADGTDQKVTGHYFDTIAVRVIDPAIGRIHSKEWTVRSLSEFIETVSPDNQTMTEDFTNTMGAETVAGNAGFVRVRERSGWLARTLRCVADADGQELYSRRYDYDLSNYTRGIKHLRRWSDV